MSLCFRSRIALAAIAVLATPTALFSAPLSLLDDHFSVVAEWRTPAGQTGTGTPVALTRETGYFWFFSPTNVELVVKVLAGCGVNDRFWVFAGGLTDLDVTLTVTDDETGESKVYRNPQGRPFAPLQDTGAFATCAVARCGRGRLADLAASPRPREDLESMASAMAGTVVAPQAVYERVLADLAEIGRQPSPLTELGFYRNVWPYTLYLELEPATADAVISGRYPAWDCLNERYGLESVAPFNRPPFGAGADLTFDKVLDTRQLAEEYAALPGVISAKPAYSTRFPVPGFFQPISSWCGEIEGSLYKYYARLSDGTLYHFTSLPGAVPVRVGTTLGNPTPVWLDEARACFREHVDSLQ